MCNLKLIQNLDYIMANCISSVSSNGWFKCKQATLEEPVMGLIRYKVDKMYGKGTVWPPTLC